MFNGTKEQQAFAQHFSTDSIDNVSLLARLKKPKLPVDVVIDTDTFNEIDDQYALAYLIKSDDRLNLKAIYAAPFLNDKSTSAAIGMQKSYEEISNILELMGRKDLQDIVYKGSEEFLRGELIQTPSAAAEHLVKLALTYSPKKPLYVIAIGAITNIASALIMRPDIKDNIVVVWLGGHALHYPHNAEFNLMQDVAAARVIFLCGVALVQLPCAGVVSAFTISGPELVHHLGGKNKLCDYLVKVTTEEAQATNPLATWTRAIWDVTAVAWLTGDFMSDCVRHVPTPEYDHRYALDCTNHLYSYVYEIKRDELFADLFAKLGQ